MCSCESYHLQMQMSQRQNLGRQLGRCIGHYHYYTHWEMKFTVTVEGEFAVQCNFLNIRKFYPILYNFGTVIEHNTHQSHVVSTQKTRSINFDAWITFVIFSCCKKDLCPLFLFCSGQLYYQPLATSLVLTLCSVYRTCVKRGKTDISLAWQVRSSPGDPS